MLKTLLRWCSVFIFSAVASQSASQKLIVGLSADYAPMEFKEENVLKGFDVDLAAMIAARMGQEIEFRDMPFSSLFPALSAGQLDCIISSVTVTPERAENFDFSDVYDAAELSLIFRTEHEPPVDLKGYKIGCQSGSTMALWAQNHALDALCTFMDLNPPLIEALKAKHLDGVILEREQARLFCQQHPMLHYRSLGLADQGYAIAFRKGSTQVTQINALLKELKPDIHKLSVKWKGF